VPVLTLDDITWENFELLAGEIFRRKGFEVEIGSGLGADGGKDLTLQRDGEVHLVQCKLLSAENKVSVMAMREFYGLLVAENAKSGIFMTTGLYSRDAKEFAEGKPIKLLGRAEIEELMASVTRPGENLCNIQDWINDFAAVAHVTNPDCPRCRKPMKLRRGPTGRQFWGCSWYPKRVAAGNAKPGRNWCRPFPTRNRKCDEAERRQSAAATASHLERSARHGG
jgi:restriction system protein